MKKCKILIIEDESSVSEDIKFLLEEEGFEAFVADSGQEGIDAAKTNLPDLIICDIMMAPIDGYAVLDALFKDTATKSIPFLFLTAKVERDDIRRGMQLGADDYLLKPFKAEELLNAINARLKRIKSFRSKPKHDSSLLEKKYDYHDKIFIKSGGQIHLLKISDIVFISTENQFTTVYLNKEKPFLVKKTIVKWMGILPGKEFLRIQKSTIINTEYIIKLEKWDNASFVVYLQNIEKPFIINKNYSSEFKNKTL